MNATTEDLKKVNIEILDDDLGKDSALGRAQLTLGKNISFQEKWIPLENCQTGEILVSVQSADLFESREDLVEKSRLNFTIMKAKDLEKSDFIGKSDPYVVLTYKDKTFKSKTINNNQNPEWNFTLILDIEHSEPGQVHVQIFDEDYEADDEIGNTVINVRDLLECDQVDGQWVKLENCKSGEVQFSSRVTQRFACKTSRTVTRTETIETPFTAQAEFDKLHKKSCKMILARVDSQGNIIEEEFDEKSSSARKSSALHLSSGIEVFGSTDEEEWKSVPVLHFLSSAPWSRSDVPLILQ